MKTATLSLSRVALPINSTASSLRAVWRATIKQVEAVEVMRDARPDLPVEILGRRKLAPLVKRDGFAKSLLDVVRPSQ